LVPSSRRRKVLPRATSTPRWNRPRGRGREPPLVDSKIHPDPLARSSGQPPSRGTKHLIELIPAQQLNQPSGLGTTSRSHDRDHPIAIAIVCVAWPSAPSAGRGLPAAVEVAFPAAFFRRHELMPMPVPDRHAAACSRFEKKPSAFFVLVSCSPERPTPCCVRNVRAIGAELREVGGGMKPSGGGEDAGDLSEIGLEAADRSGTLVSASVPAPGEEAGRRLHSAASADPPSTAPSLSPAET
jgi:hypothetical protein